MRATERPPELRHDELTTCSVILAPGRAARPAAFRSDPSPASRSFDAGCPFCPGNEEQTPPEIARRGGGDEGKPGWQVRVVPNLYPIVSAEGRRGARGAHEVFVLSPAHDRPLERLDPAEVAAALAVARERAADRAADGSAFVQVLVNQGAAAGASLSHPHGQIAALEAVPPAVAAGVTALARHTADPVLETVEQVSSGAALVAEIGDAVAWCPYASLVPYQIRFALPSAGAHFSRATDREIEQAATLLRSALSSLAAVAHEPAYNVVVRTAPTDVADDGYHWFVDVLPRLANFAGLELATGLLVNIVEPLDAAVALRVAARG